MVFKTKVLIGVFFALMLSISSSSASSLGDEAEEEWFSLSEILANKKIAPDWQDKHGHSIIYLQLMYGSESVAIQYFKKAKQSKKWNKEKTSVLLFAAVFVGSQRFVQTLLDIGESPESVRPETPSPLILAASLGHLEIMRMLMKAKANLYYSESKEISADSIRSAFLGGHARAAYLLMDGGLDLGRYKAKKYQGGLIFYAVSGGNPKSIELLSRNDFDLNLWDENGETPLTYAAFIGANEHITKSLLLFGADPCRKNKRGEVFEQVLARLRLEEDHANRKYEGPLEAGNYSCNR